MRPVPKGFCGACAQRLPSAGVEVLTVLVTGGAGFIGSHLVDKLVADGLEVVVLDNLLTGRPDNLRRHLGDRRLKLVKGNVANQGDAKQALHGVEAVFHLAALASTSLSVRNPTLANKVNLGGTLNLLEMCRRAHVQRFVYASSCAVYGEAQYLPIDENHPTEPLSPYGASKLAGEAYCRVFHKLHGLETLCLRYFNVYGPRQPAGTYAGVIHRFVDRLTLGRPLIVYGDGEQTRDFVYVSDVVQANLLALACRGGSGEALNIGGGRPVTVNWLAHELARIVGAQHTRILHKPPRKGEIRNIWGAIERAAQALGYRPRVSLEEGLKFLTEPQP